MLTGNRSQSKSVCLHHKPTQLTYSLNTVLFCCTYLNIPYASIYSQSLCKHCVCIYSNLLSIPYLFQHLHTLHRFTINMLYMLLSVSCWYHVVSTVCCLLGSVKLNGTNGTNTQSIKLILVPLLCVLNSGTHIWNIPWSCWFNCVMPKAMIKINICLIVQPHFE